MAAPLAHIQGRSSGSGKTLGVDLEALYAELAQVQQANGEGMTTSEIRERLGISEYATSMFIRAANKAGRLTVRREPRQAVDGVWRRVPVYLFGMGK